MLPPVASSPRTTLTSPWASAASTPGSPASPFPDWNTITGIENPARTSATAIPEDSMAQTKAFLEKYDWPGNVRELENVIKRACVLSTGTIIEKKDQLIEEANSYSIKDFLEEKLKRYLKDMAKITNFNLYDTVLSEGEKALISIILKETNGNQIKTARLLGINRNTLRTKIKEYKIKK